MKDFSPSTHIRSLPPATADYLQGEGAEGHNEVQLREYLKIVFKYRSIIAAALVLSVLFSLMYAFTATPLYTTQSVVRISTYEPLLTGAKIEDMLQDRTRESTFLETQIQELKSFSLADKVLENQAVRSKITKQESRGFLSQLFGKKEEAPVAPSPESRYQAPVGLIRSYLAMIDVKPVRRTSLVGIQVTADDPELASMIANHHATSYMDWVRQVRVEQQARGLTFLRAQADELREKVADLDRELADYAETNSIVAVNKDENITAQKLSQLNRLLTDATAKRIEVENNYKEAEASLKNPSAGFDDGSTQSMRSELAKLEGELQQLLGKFTDQYPRVQQVRAQVEGLRRSIEGQRRQVVSGLMAKMLASQQEEKNLQEELDQQKSQAFELAKRQVQYNVLNRDLTSSRTMLENVLRQIKETSLAVESNASNISVVDFAVPPSIPSFPRKSFMLLVGAVVGLVIGLSLALLLNYLDNTVRTPEDLTQLLRIPSLGVVPSFELEELPPAPSAGAAGGNSSGPSSRGGPSRTPGGQGVGSPGAAPGSLAPLVQTDALKAIAFLSDPRSLAAEAYRTIRTGILLSQAGEPPRTLLVTSAQSSEGKTTSSINLAASLASAGGRVVIIDADLRRPSVHKHFGLTSNSPGLVEVITGMAKVEDVAIRDVVKRVTLIPSGTIPPNPAELLGSLEMAGLIDELAQSFDYVIIDSPPILPVTDSVILSRYVDGVVLVVRGASTPRKVIKDAKDRLKVVGARFLGAILNDVDITSGDYYYYNRYYHSYYHNEQDADAATGTPRRRRRKEPPPASMNS
jgi:succinoglycan biosynthesis transport protein ExoP